MSWARNERVGAKPGYHRMAPVFHHAESRVHMLVVCMDYSKTTCPLPTEWDARNFVEFSRCCGVQDLTILKNEECTVKAFLGAIRRAGEACGPDDYFVLYFAGHGTCVSEVSDKPADAEAEALVCVDSQGQISTRTLLSDEELSNTILQSCPEDARILILADLCHSGPVANLTLGRWAGRQALSITGCRERSTAVDAGRCGIFTHCILLAADKLAKVGHEDYSVGMLFNAALNEDAVIFGRMQDMMIQAALDSSPQLMAWPLVPSLDYEAPLNRLSSTDMEVLERLGINPAMLKNVRASELHQPVSVEKYNDHVMGAHLSSGPCRVCFAGSQCSMQ